MNKAKQRHIDTHIARVAERWGHAAAEIFHFTSTMQDAVGEDVCQKMVPGLESSVAELRSAINRFESALKQPKVIIATTGTTSSGKSTLVNLLVGENLLPQGVLEMSAGVVAIQHENAIRRLTIEETKGAKWQTGTWNDLAATDVLIRLEETMTTYRELLKNDGTHTRTQVEPPRFQILWPTRMGANPTHFGLPSGAQLTILDLPGLKYIDDTDNRKVIMEQVKKALCIVTYNSEESDPTKQDSLLLQVVDQVKELRGSPARMFFVLNRIDAFLRDRDPQSSENRFKTEVTKKIRHHVSEALPEHADEANRILPVALSSQPALFAVLAEKNPGDSSLPFLMNLETKHRNLFPDDELEQLPRPRANWSDSQRRWFLNEARHQSRLEEFECRLATHIENQLPEILLPELVGNTYEMAQKTLTELDALIDAYMLQEREQAEEAKEKLETLNQSLINLKKNVLAILEPLQDIETVTPNELNDLVQHVEMEIQSRSQKKDFKLFALRDGIGEAIRQPIHRLNNYTFSRMTGETTEDSLVQSTGNESRLRAAVDQLRSCPYGKIWRTGGSLEGSDAQQLEKVLNNFAKELSASANDLIARESAIQAERIKDAFSVLAEAVINILEEGAAVEFEKHGFQGLHSVFRGGFDLKPPQLPPVHFTPDIRHWTRTDEKTEEQEYWTQESPWWTLWLIDFDVKKTRSVVVKTTKEGVTVNKLGDLLDAFSSSANVSALLSTFARWVYAAIQNFEKSLEQRLQGGVKIYRLALEARIDEIEAGTKSRIEGLEKQRANLERIRLFIEQARNWRESSNG